MKPRGAPAENTMIQHRAWPAIACALVFVALGSVFVDYAGLQADEVSFAAPLFRPWSFFSVHFFHRSLPLMMMSYYGSLKTWLYAPLLVAAHPNAALIRVPGVLLGGATILLFWALLTRIHGCRAAWVGSLLLATDTSFLLMTTYDWGPVVLQHLLFVAALFFAVRWFQTFRSRSLAVSAFCCGLAFWDKAVFLWVFAGVLAGSLVFASALRRRISRRAAAIGVGALCLGALPLMVYNLAARPRFATIRANAGRSSEFHYSDLPQRLQMMRVTWSGSALFGYLVRENDAAQPDVPASQFEQAVFRLQAFTGEHRNNWMLPALALALGLLPLLWRTPARQPMLFCLIAILVAWGSMIRANGGGSAHQAVLLWPLPHMLLAVAFAEAAQHVRWGRWLLAAGVAALAAGNLLVTNQYLYQFIRNGPADFFTDAIYGLAGGLRQSHARQIVAIDWGLEGPLCVLNRYSPPSIPADDPLSAANLPLLSDPQAIWVGHASGHEVQEGVNNRLWSAARQAGFEPEVLQTYCDRNGRAIFQTFRFQRSNEPRMHTDTRR
jgi:hypothetical protein